jgi:2-amino-4-hydroxy-6-hydroxymethyldihydropteridine diphosphokinase
MTAVYVAAGSNVEPERNLARACGQIAKQWPDARFSRAYRNAAVGFEGPEFINLVVGFTTDQALGDVLATLHGIEHECGRPRNAPKWASRTMDLDILLYGDLIEKTAEYTVPRPDLLKRPFMLGPMAEIAPYVRHPLIHKTMAELWSEFDRAAHEMTPVEIEEVPGRVVPGRGSRG